MTKMSKRLVFVIACVLTVFGLKQSVFAENLVTVNEKTFPDKNFREAVLSAWKYAKPSDDYDDDYYDDDYYDDDYYDEYNLQKSSDEVIDADLIKNVYFNGTYGKKYVSNLKGIELLTNLEEITLTPYKGGKFDLSKNTKLKDVEIESTKYTMSVADFSKLPSLRKLELRGKVANNFIPSSLKNLQKLCLDSSTVKSIDISKNKKLEAIDATSMSALTKVVFPKSSILDRVYISDGKKLKSVNVSMLPKLSLLVVRDCDISKIDVSKNKELIFLKVNGNKKIKSIDLSKNTKLGRLNVGYTGISKINLKNNKNLNILNVYNTKITSLNLSKNLKLTDLDVSGDNIKSVNLSKHKELYWINIVNSKIKSLDLRNNKKVDCVEYSAGQKVLYPKKISDYMYITIVGVKKGSSVSVPSICKGYKFEKAKDSKLSYKNNKIVTSKKAKRKYDACYFKKGKKYITLTIQYK